jgi:hypothetical protein
MPRTEAVGALLDALPWSYETATFDSLGFRFSVRTTDPALGSHLDDLYRACVTDDDAITVARYTIRERAGRDDTRFVVHCDGQRVISTPHPSVALDYLVWDVNRRTAAVATDSLLVHAGAVAVNGAAILVPARSGGGKSTLVSALVLAGCDYVTDETVAIDPQSGWLRGAPKPIALKPGALEMFGDVLAPPDRVVARYTTETRHVAVGELAGVPATPPLPVRIVALPDLQARGDEVATPLTRAETMAFLAEQSYNFDQFGPRRLPTLARALEQAACYRLDTSDLPAAVATLLALRQRESRPAAHTMPRRRSDIECVVVDRELVAYDPSRACLHLLNPTAALVWERCDGTRAIGAIVDELAATHGTSNAIVEADVRACLADFAERGLLRR